MKLLLLTPAALWLLAATPAFAYATEVGPKASIGECGQKQGGKAPVIDGYTGDQRSFLAWAQLWRNITSEGETRRRALADPHSPGEFRVNGIVRNVDAWYAAFNIKPGDKLYLAPKDRVRIW